MGEPRDTTARFTSYLIVALLGASNAHCVGDSPSGPADAGVPQGQAGGHCFSNGTCNAGLVCVVPDLCAVPDAGADADASTPDAGGDTGSASDAGSLATSCSTPGDGLTNCGGGSESCCATVLVTGGTFHRTYTNTGSGSTAVADLASVSGFRLDKYVVTVGRFRQFVAAWKDGTGWVPQAGSGKHTHLNSGNGLNASSGGYESGWLSADDGKIAANASNLIGGDAYATWTPTASGGHEKLPINKVNWWEAVAFCIWDGGFLPSETEWEYAAAGGAEERQYPWGTAAPGTASQYAIYGDNAGNCNYPSPAPCTGVANIAPVGTPPLGVGKYGQRDPAGNVGSWTLDWYGAYATPCTDCVAAAAGSYRVVRGGNYFDVASLLQPPYRGYLTPTARYSNYGIRCARMP